MKIVLEHLTKQFPPRGKKAQEPVTAVNNFNFEIPDGTADRSSWTFRLWQKYHFEHDLRS